MTNTTSNGPGVGIAFAFLFDVFRCGLGAPNGQGLTEACLSCQGPRRAARLAGITKQSTSSHSNAAPRRAWSVTSLVLSSGQESLLTRHRNSFMFAATAETFSSSLGVCFWGLRLSEVRGILRSALSGWDSSCMVVWAAFVSISYMSGGLPSAGAPSGYAS